MSDRPARVVNMGSNSVDTDLKDPTDTFAGRLIQAGMTGLFVALPDYISSRLLRGAVTTAIGLGGGALLASLTGYRGSVDAAAVPDTDPAVWVDRMRQSIGDIGAFEGPASDSPAGALNLDSPLRTALILGAALLVILLLMRLDVVTRRWLARKLSERGVRRPNTVLGLISFAVVLLVNEAAARDRQVRA